MRPIWPRGYMFFPDPNIDWLGETVKPWKGKERMWMAIFGLPFDGATVSHRRGSRHAPSRIREYLYSKTNYSVEHDSQVTDGVFDCGDLEVNIADFKETMRRLRKAASLIFEKAENILALGGDHSLSYELIRAAASKAQGEVALIQFDAHHDTRVEWGQHSGFWLRRLIDEGILQGRNVYQLGIRGSLYSKYYINQLKSDGIRYLTVWAIREMGLQKTVNELVKVFRGFTNVYVTFDIDAVDQAFAPGTDYPSTGGLSSWEVIYMLYEFASRMPVRWLDIMEVSPPHDVSDQTVKLAAELATQYIHARAKTRNH